MNIRQTKAVKKIIALLLCFALIAAVISCGIVCVRFITHPCCGNDCRTCDLLLNTAQAIKQVSQVLLLTGMVVITCRLLALNDRNIFLAASRNASLVHLKIRLNS